MPQNQKPKLRITSPFGARHHPVTGEYHMHNGVDFALSEGTPLKSPINGVAKPFEDAVNGYGVAIEGELSPGQWVRITYSHMLNGAVAGGVQVGQVLGYSGNTGRSTAPHVHIGVKLNGQYVDPLSVLDFSGYTLIVTP